MNDFEFAVVHGYIHYIILIFLHMPKAVEVFDFAPYPECTQGMTLPLPKVAPQVSVKAERTVIDRNTPKLLGTDAVESYYDTASQQGVTVLNHGRGRRPRWLWDFKSNQVYYISDNQTCVSPTNARKNACKITFSVFLTDLATTNYPTYSSVKVSERCNFTVTPLTFIRAETIRSIPVRVWRQCWYDGQSNKVTQLHYYSAVLGIPPDKPVRLESRDLTMNNTSNILEGIDVIHYSEHVDDPGIFIPPSGAFCGTWSKSKKAMPSFPTEVTLDMTVLSTFAKKIHRMTIFVDRINERTQFYTASVKSPQTSPATSNPDVLQSYVTLHDHPSGLEFVLTYWDFYRSRKLEVTCNVSAIEENAADGPESMDEWSHQMINSQNAYQLFGMINAREWIYFGERDYEGVPCYVWSRQQIAKKTGFIFITEVYWIKEDWSPVNISTFYGMVRYQKSSNGTTLEIYKTSVTEYSGVIGYFYRQIDIFVNNCLRLAGSQPFLLSFRIKLQNSTGVMGNDTNESAFLVGLRNALSELLDTSALRMADMEIALQLSQNREPETDNHATIWMTVLEWVKMKTQKGAPEELQSQQLVERFRNILNGSDQDITVYYRNKAHSVTLIGNSLLAKTLAFGNRSAMHTRGANFGMSSVLSSQKSRKNGYSSSDMTGLAFALIIVSGCAGFAGGYFHRKWCIPFHR